MARVLTGIQSTGVPHLGNLLGAIIPAIKISQNSKNESLFFIADLHSFTTVRDKEVLQENTYATAAAWLAFGFDTKKNLFYRQSDVPQVCELTWYLNCFTPFPMLANAHSFKDKSDRLFEVNSGLFTYPVLMAADILLYDAEIVPVGKDQIQHLEITRDIAGPERFTYREFVSLIGKSMGVRRLIIPIPPIIGWFAGKLMGIFLRDRVITRAEIRGLMNGLVASEEEPLGDITFSQWIAKNGSDLGREYQNDLQERRYNK